MFTLNTNPDRVKELITQFQHAFAAGATVRKQWLSTPAGGFEAVVHHRADLDIWSFIDVEGDGNKHLCWFGAGQPHWRAAIEMNIPLTRNMNYYGQLVVEGDSPPQLAHRGGLGGGRYSVKPEVFADLIRGFVRDDVLDGARVRRYFIIGSPDDPRMLDRLAAYIREAVEIRRLREDETAFATALKDAGGHYTDGTALGGDYTDESDKGGTYYVNRLTAFRRMHAKVQIALARELKLRSLDVANARLHGGIGPDVYIRDPSGRMASVYEIKVGADAQSIFTAIGQLAVYSAEAPAHARKYLVVRGMPRSRLFALALGNLGIRTVTYRADGDAVTFAGIED